MDEMRACFDDIEASDEADVRAKCQAAVKMLFALIDSVDECAALAAQKKVYRRYKTLIKQVNDG